MGWSIKCNNGGNCGATIDDNGKAVFQPNTSTASITYTITYTDENGKCGSITITQPGCSVTIIASTHSLECSGTATFSVSEIYSYEFLRTQFNSILTDNHYNEIVDGSGVDNYLRNSYEIAITEYAKPNSPYFSKNTYDEVFNGTKSQWGNNSTYEENGIALNAMTSWLMAMQLSELVADSGMTTNTPTKLYTAAYNLFKENRFGCRIPLYGDYTLKGDPAITRTVAGALYCVIRAKEEYSFSVIDSFRNALGGSKINSPYINECLGCTEDAYKTGGYIASDCSGIPYALSYTKRIGYMVNANDVLPPAAGPYVSPSGWNNDFSSGCTRSFTYQSWDTEHKNPECSYDTRCPSDKLVLLSQSERNALSDRTLCYDLHCSGGRLDTIQDASIFDSSTHNYKFDIDVDNYVTSHYNLNSSCDENLSRTVQAITDSNEDMTHFFANTTYYNYSSLTQGNIKCYNESFVAGSPDDNDGYFTGVFNSDVTGKDLSSLLTTGTQPPYSDSNLSRFFGKVHYCVSHSRQTLLLPQYGRMRPGASNPEGIDNKARSTSDSSKNHLGDSSIDLLSGGSTKYDIGTVTPYHYYVDTNGNGTYSVLDSNRQIYEPVYTPGEVKAAQCYTRKDGMKSHTYPSGHNAGAWTITMFLMEMLKDKADLIYKAGYKFGVSRTIIRAHWHSDTIYGKFIAMMNVPILHAVEEVNSASVDNPYPNTEHTGRFRIIDSFNEVKQIINGA